MSHDFQFKLINTINDIEKGQGVHLDITELSGKKGYFRYRIGKFRIIFYKDNNGEYIIDEVGSRGDIYK